MSKLPILSGLQLIAAMEKLGWYQARSKGSHVAMVRRSVPPKTVTVPLHKEIARGTLRKILRDSDITIEHLNTLM